MALGNIFREPRREITETIIGVAIVSAVIYADYCFGVWLQSQMSLRSDPTHWDGFWVMGMMIGAAGLSVSVILLFGAHALGEGICNRLQDAGIHLRPRQRR